MVKIKSKKYNFPLDDSEDIEEEMEKDEFEENKQILNNTYYAVLKTEENEDGEKQIFLKSGKATLEWQGEGEESSLWDDSKILQHRFNSTKFIKLKSCLNEDRNTKLNEDENEQIDHGIWVNLDIFMEEFEYLSV